MSIFRKTSDMELMTGFHYFRLMFTAKSDQNLGYKPGFGLTDDVIFEIFEGSDERAIAAVKSGRYDKAALTEIAEGRCLSRYVSYGETMNGKIVGVHEVALHKIANLDRVVNDARQHLLSDT